MRIPFLQTFDARSRGIARQRLVNCHAVQNPVGSKSQIAVTRAPGIETWCSDLPEPARAWTVFKGELFVASGHDLYKIAPNGISTKLGYCGSALDMAAGDTQILIASVGEGYVWNGSTVSEITDDGYTDWEWVEWLDGFFIGGKHSEQTFYNSDLGDAFSHNTLNVAAAEARPDYVVDALVDHRELVVAGTESVEIFYNAGNSQSPLMRIPSGTIELGCIGTTLAALENSFYWLASDYTVRRLEGLTPVRVSTDAIEDDLAGTTSANGFSWQAAGRRYYSIVTPDKCYTMDLYTGLWHERESFGGATWRIKGSANCYGRQLLFDSWTGRIGIAGLTHTEFGDTMRWWARSGTIHAEGRRLFHGKLELIFEKGSGTTEDPSVMLRWSDDDGQTWSTELWRGLGKEGEYEDRVIFHRLGSSRSRIYELNVTDAVPVTLTDAIGDIR